MKSRFDEKQRKWGWIAFLVVAFGIIVFFVIYRFQDVKSGYQAIISILMPFIYGLVMAYLLCPLYNLIVRHFHNFLRKNNLMMSRSIGISKTVGTVVSILCLLVVIVGIGWMIIPGLIDSISRLIDILPGSMEKFSAWCAKRLVNFPDILDTVNGWIDSFTNNTVEFIADRIMPGYDSLLADITAGVRSVLSVVWNGILGIIICTYFLNIKSTVAAQLRKLTLAVFKEHTARKILSWATFTNKTFGGFISGKIIDSLIVGIICFICMSIFGWEYTLLISCIIGITNIIPFFGPFIGAIPSALLLLIVNPWHCLWFIVFVLLLQIFDGYIMAPKILGDSTGLASFWVLFAVIVGGGLFGVIGMILGIPVFAVIYALISEAVNGSLEKRGFSTDLSVYRADSYKSRRSRRGNKKKKGGTEDDDSDDDNIEDDDSGMGESEE